MKLPPQDTVAAFEQPSVRNWLVVFLCGFLTVCIFSPGLCLGLWLLRLAALAIKVPLPAMLQDIPAASAVRITLLVATGFGALLATMMVLELVRRRRREFHLHGSHPEIGGYEHSPYLKTWHASPTLPTGDVVRLNGQGSTPTEAQAALWRQFASRYDELYAMMTAALLTPPHPLEWCDSVTLKLDAVTLDADGRLQMAFQFASVPEAVWNSETEEPVPVAVFSPALELEKAEWITPRI